jgi:hypothetical protein
MVVTCAFYGLVNRTTKVMLQVDRQELEVGKVFTFDGDNYVILSVFEADDTYHANVALEHVHRARTLLRSKATGPSGADFDERRGRNGRQESVLQARLKAVETRLQRVLQERDEALRLLDRAIQQLNRLQQADGA